MSKFILCAASLALLAGCSGLAVAPSLMSLPGSGKNLAQFQTDDGSCRKAAQALIAGQQQDFSSSIEEQEAFDRYYLQCMYSKGHKIPVPAGSDYQTPTALSVPPLPDLPAPLR